MKKPSAKFITIRKHKEAIAAFQANIDVLQGMVTLASDDREKNLKSLRQTINFTEDLSKKSKVKIDALEAEMKDIKARLNKIEPFILSCLDQEQRDFATTLGISHAEYGIQYLRTLYENRHIIHAARNLQ